MLNTRLIDRSKPLMGCPPAALTSTAGDGDQVNMALIDKLMVIIAVNNATTVTGGAVTLKQSTSAAGAGEKALAFDTVFANEDTGASDTLVETAVVSNTFTTDTTDNKDLLYVIEVNQNDLDTANGFTHVRVDVASMANAVGTVVYVPYCTRYAPVLATALTD